MAAVACWGKYGRTPVPPAGAPCGRNSLQSSSTKRPAWTRMKPCAGGQWGGKARGRGHVGADASAAGNPTVVAAILPSARCILRGTRCEVWSKPCLRLERLRPRSRASGEEERPSQGQQLQAPHPAPGEAKAALRRGEMEQMCATCWSDPCCAAEAAALIRCQGLPSLEICGLPARPGECCQVFCSLPACKQISYFPPRLWCPTFFGVSL